MSLIWLFKLVLDYSSSDSFLNKYSKFFFMAMELMTQFTINITPYAILFYRTIIQRKKNKIDKEFMRKIKKNQCAILKAIEHGIC